jgi:hypothetical protein
VDKASEYGRIYSQVCNGFSRKLIDKKYVYFKHPTLAEHFSTYSNYEIYINEGRAKGLYNEEEKIKEAINGGWWTRDKEYSVDFLKKTIENLHKTKSKLILPSQKDQIDFEIKRSNAILITYTRERNEIVGYTVDDYANSKLTEQLLIFFSYKDEEFKQKLFETPEEYYEESDEYVNDLRGAFNTYSMVFSNHNLKRVGASGFFQNLVYLNNDAYSFWGKPTYNCTRYQIDTLLYGKMYRNTINSASESGKPIPDEIVNDADNLVEWVDNQSSNSTESKFNRRQQNSKNAVGSYVGATREDLQKLGVKVEKIGGKSLLQLAEERGGIIEKNDYLNLRENG